jgi:endonuclease/exonuclease/phosphatase family metal-dependent hydrolase
MTILQASHCRFSVRGLCLLGLAWAVLGSGSLVTAWAVELGVVESGANESGANESENAFKLMTYNIRYDNFQDGKDAWVHRADTVVDLLSKQDLFGLQEVTAGQLKTLLARLPEFDFYGLGSEDGRGRGEHAPIGIRKSRFEALERGTFWLSKNPDRVGVAGWDAALPRTCTWMLVKDRVSGKKLWVANTHFDHRGSTARLESARLIKRVVTEQPLAIPVVVMGDFNCLPKSPPFMALVSGQSLKDARVLSQQKVAGPNSTWNGFREIDSGRIIDHIFVRGSIRIETLSTLNPKTSVGRYASDHLPVQVLVGWPQSDVTGN